MRIADKIYDYVTAEQASGRLRPGDKLPSHMELCRKFNTSYATVFNAIANFERAGLVVRKRGKGVYLSGNKSLQVMLEIDDDHVLSPEVLDYLNKRCEEDHLYLTLIPAKSKNRKNSMPPGVAAMISTNDFKHASIMDYSSFPDYDKLMRQLVPYGRKCNTELPFYIYVQQLYINPKIAEKSGLSNEVSGENFDWIDKIIERAEKGEHSLYHDYWMLDEIGAVFRYVYVLLGMLLRSGRTIDDVWGLPFFHTDAGRRLVKLLRSMRRDEVITGNFNSSICNFYTGSWFAVQYKNKFNLDDDEVRIMPYSYMGRNLYYLKQSVLRTYISDGLSFPEKQRIWSLLKIFFSKEFQQFFCNRTGSISVRKDITDYSWNTHPDFDAFIPRPGGIAINGDIITGDALCIFSALVEQAAFFNADIESILDICDLKLRDFSFEAIITKI